MTVWPANWRASLRFLREGIPERFRVTALAAVHERVNRIRDPTRPNEDYRTVDNVFLRGSASAQRHSHTLAPPLSRMELGSVDVPHRQLRCQARGAARQTAVLLGARVPGRMESSALR